MLQRKDRSSEQSQWARSKRKHFWFVSRKRLSPLHTARVKSEPGKLRLLWWLWHAINHINLGEVENNLPAPRTDTSSKILHPKPVHLKSNQHTNSSCCLTEHKEEFYCFSYKNEKDNLIVSSSTSCSGSCFCYNSNKDENSWNLLCGASVTQEKMVAHLGLRNSFFLWMM